MKSRIRSEVANIDRGQLTKGCVKEYGFCSKYDVKKLFEGFELGNEVVLTTELCCPV